MTGFNRGAPPRGFRDREASRAVTAGALASVLAAAGVGACQGCHTTGGGASTVTPLPPGAPTLRLYVVSDLAGALEPCGCTKDQLGGLDHAAAWITSERAHAPISAVVLAGPAFFMNATPLPDHKDQDLLKAKTIARGLKTMGCLAVSPGENDWADGEEELGKLRLATGAALLTARSPGDGKGGGKAASKLVTLNGVSLGLIGVGAPREGASGPAPAELVKTEAAALEKQGAKILVVLASVGRGEAKRIADSVPELAAIVVGSAKSAGEANTETPPGERVGQVVIAETANHLQSVVALDFFVRDGSYAFADATGLDAAQKRAELLRRIDELHVKISNWQRDKSIAEVDLEARRADLAKLEAERAALDDKPAPASGSFFRYSVKEVRDSLGRDPAVEKEIAGYYKAVNEDNRTIFADRMPPAPVPGKPTYVGVQVCAKCHEPARVFWDTTKHSHAYTTLSSQNKEFNLDCVSCHVTGYDQPGGSSVTHVDLLKDVQCEVCHGPGSVHSANPKIEVVTKKPSETRCLDCHHPPHVEEFDSKAKMTEILGPGHGL
jgi:Cytochrome c554 and c-prime